MINAYMIWDRTTNSLYSAPRPTLKSVKAKISRFRKYDINKDYVIVEFKLDPCNPQI